jgi:alpha-beta hydrolase superfamily lysophospholipase
MQRIDFESDVTDAVDLGVVCTIAGSVFLPSDPTRSGTLLAAVPGGTYDRSYWHLEIAGHSGYSFAADFVDRGAIVLTLDNLGTGLSTRPPDGDRLSFEVLAAANHSAIRDIAVRIETGALDASIQPLPDLNLVGVGHSLGGMLVTTQQSAYGDFERIAVLGSSFLGNRNLPDLSVEQVAAMLEQQADGGNRDGYLNVPRSTLRLQFHAADVPPDVLAADELGATLLPRMAGATAVVSTLAAHHARRVTAPLFLTFGDNDMSPDPHAELALYGSTDLTLFLLPGSAHCHNVAGTRQQLWDRLAQWVGLPAH